MQGLIETELNLHLCKQEPRQLVVSYYAKFKEMAQIYQNNGSAPGATAGWIQEKLFAMRVADPDNPSTAMHKAAQAFLIDIYHECRSALLQRTNPRPGKLICALQQFR